jgi:hypothetical protein
MPAEHGFILFMLLSHGTCSYDVSHSCFLYDVVLLDIYRVSGLLSPKTVSVLANR